MGSFHKFYKLGKLLGAGTYGKVYQCIDKVMNKEFAVKIISTTEADVSESDVQKEIDMLKLFSDHPRILGLKETFKEPGCAYLIMELMKGGDLLNSVFVHGVYAETDARKILKELLEGMVALRKKRVSHGDLKPCNIMLAAIDRTDVKIGDMGFAQYVPKGSKLHGLCGTYQYMAPETLATRADEKYAFDFRADMWSVGCIACFLLCGYLPSTGEETAKERSDAKRKVIRDLHSRDISEQAIKKARNRR